jgi:hypothetical protein
MNGRATPPGGTKSLLRNALDHWKLVGLIALILLIAGGQIFKDRGTSSEAHHEPTGRVTASIQPAMTAHDGNFWQRLTDEQRLTLATECRAQAAEPSAASFGTRDQILTTSTASIVGDISGYFADPGNAVLGNTIADACENAISDEIVAGTDGADKQAARAQARSDAQYTRIIDSVRNHTFQATDGFVRAYMSDDSIGTSIRSVSCINGTDCAIAYNDLDPESHPILSKIFGSEINDVEFQLIQPMTALFKALFSDPRFQSGTLTSWINFQTVGGEVVKAPVLTVTCDRAADTQINWDNVGPAGLQQLCSNYKLLPDGTP